MKEIRVSSTDTMEITFNFREWPIVDSLWAKKIKKDKFFYEVLTQANESELVYIRVDALEAMAGIDCPARSALRFAMRGSATRLGASAFCGALKKGICRRFFWHVAAKGVFRWS